MFPVHVPRTPLTGLNRTKSEIHPLGNTARPGHAMPMKGDNIAERLETFGSDIILLVRDLATDKAGRHIADELLRSGTAGGSNYQEARSAQSRRDFVHKVSMAAKELREAIYWLALVEHTSLGHTEIARALRREAGELVAILVASARTAKSGASEGNR